MENSPEITTRDELLAAINPKTGGVRCAAVARAIGMSPATISTWLKDTYAGDNNKVEEKVRKYLELLKERKACKVRWVVKPDFIQTLTSEKIFEAIKLCHLKNRIGVVTGDAGLGKTTSAREYTRQTSGVIFVEADKTFSAKVLFQNLHRQCGATGVGNVADLFNDVLSKLRDSGRLIIVDQAEFLPEKALDLLRTIYDKAHIGIILIGLPRLISILRGRRGENVYLFSRVSLHRALNETQPEDAQAIVNAILPAVNGLWKEFYASARSYECGRDDGKPNARTLVFLIDRTIDLANLNKVEITPELIKAAAQTLVR